MALARFLRRVLDATYTAAGVLAALCLVAILVIIVLQMSARWIGEVVPGSTDYAGYFMAAASFFAFAHALQHGAHIRVSILLNALGRWRWLCEAWCLGIAASLASYFAWYAVKATWWSYKLHDISQGQDATPLWIPQTTMSVGTVLLAVCFWDNLVRLLLTGSHGIRATSIDGASSE
ncbi:MAG: TRAP transporter small permease subunit [Ectothiorhodospiraceae bacterium]|nr:TRAP transporter small permease subunit [Chromatiales bacterium]MCP5154378.1 TRAP transporter small permease subunit [Ectothiorhodospiraceae bacterium]